MDLVKRAGFLAILAASFVAAQTLSLTIGSTVATGNYAMKAFGFAFRMNNCVDPANAQVAVTAETPGRSSPMRAVPVPNQPGAYSVPDPGEGAAWIAAVAATCKGETVGALVPFNGRTFNREAIRMLPHAPTKAEIETALKNLPASPSEPPR